MSPLSMFLMKMGKAGGKGLGAIGHTMAEGAEYAGKKAMKHGHEGIGEALDEGSKFLSKHEKLAGGAAIGAGVGAHSMVGHGEEEEYEHDEPETEEESEYERMLRKREDR